MVVAEEAQPEEERWAVEARAEEAKPEEERWAVEAQMAVVE